MAKQKRNSQSHRARRKPHSQCLLLEELSDDNAITRFPSGVKLITVVPDTNIMIA